jgi:Type IV secretion system pilin
MISRIRGTARTGAGMLLASGALFFGYSAGANAQGSGGGNPPTGGNSGGCVSGQLCNPLSSPDIQTFLLRIIDVLLVFALPIIIFFIMYSGYLFVTARGDQGQITTARTALTWSVVGGVIILGARLIISVIQGTVAAL